MEINTIIHWDSLEYMRTLPDKCIDLVITSPPYDDIRDYNWWLVWSLDIFKDIANELARIIKEWWVIVWVVWDWTVDWWETGTSFRQALYFQEIWLNIHDTMIWSKDTFSFPDKTRYRQTIEYMFVLSKWKPKSINLINDKINKYKWVTVHWTSRWKNGETFQKSNHNKSEVWEMWVRYNIWDIPTEKSNKTWHPAVFPMQIPIDHINTWSNKWDLILDCFAWSWTTAVAAIETGRNYIVIEKEADYIEIIKKRVKNTTPPLFCI